MFAAITLGGLGTAFGALVGSIVVGLLVTPDGFPLEVHAFTGNTGETALTGISYTPLYILKTESDVEGTRYQVVPIRSAINNNLFPEMNDAFTAAIAHLRTNTASDYDSGK